jgi:hypothetical protein
MPRTRQLSLREALHLATEKSLELGWLYLPSSDPPTLDTQCLLVSDAEESEAVAKEMGFPHEGLDTSTIEDTTLRASQLKQNPSDELLLESFIYYWRFDAWLPEIGAPEPPPWEETKKKLDREFYELLGAERQNVPCKKEGCSRGAITSSVFCRVHHFEMIKKEGCPFND